MELVFATNNKHKLDEIKAAIDKSIRIVSLDEMNIREEIPETQETIEGNAIQKARYIFEKYKINCFADDTGLEVEALNGRPGVYSARYAGENCTFRDNVNKLLGEMQNKKNRSAKFRTIIAFVNNGEVNTFEGSVDGEITEDAAGNEGFGYDPVFKPSGFATTFAQMSQEEKNGISHRGKAVSKFVEYLKTLSESTNQK